MCGVAVAAEGEEEGVHVFVGLEGRGAMLVGRGMVCTLMLRETTILMFGE